MTTEVNYRQLAEAVLQTEAAAILGLIESLDEGFDKICQVILGCQGRVVVSGVGKSGHIGQKLASTFASTGTPAFFLHPGEASHGDLGMLTSQDVLIALSHSGNTPELMALLPALNRLAIPLILLTGHRNSKLANAYHYVLPIEIEKEACPLGLAPTASSTATLAMGDALAVACLTAKGFTPEDFAKSHPGGRLGRRLLAQTKDVMFKEQAIPKVYKNTSLKDALIEITEKKIGCTTVVDNDDTLLGIFTDGDLRRAFDHPGDILTQPIEAFMTPKSQTIAPTTLAAVAAKVMEDNKINALPVVDASKVVGIVTMHHLLQAGVL